MLLGRVFSGAKNLFVGHNTTGTSAHLFCRKSLAQCLSDPYIFESSSSATQPELHEGECLGWMNTKKASGRSW